MPVATTIAGGARLNLLFLCPLVYRPLKDNFAKRFTILSRWSRGHIFTLSGQQYRNLPISDFFFHSEQLDGSSVSGYVRGFWAQTVLPLLLLRRRLPVDVIIVYDPYRSGLSGAILKHLLSTKLIVEINGDYHRIPPGGNRAKTLLMRCVSQIALKQANAIKVLNRDQEAVYGGLFPGKPIYRFPDFVATEYFQSLHAYQGDYLLSVGHPFDLKGVDVLIHAFKRIATRHAGTKLRVMGYCPDQDLIKYQQMTEGHPRIQFIKPGWIEDVGEQIRGCYALVNAARSEAMGRVHIEAMACGKPIVATRTNGAIECIEDGRTGLLCEIGDAEDLSKKLDLLLSHRHLARQMGEAGKRRAEVAFSEKRYASSFLAMLEDVTGAKIACRLGAPKHTAVNIG